MNVWGLQLVAPALHLDGDRGGVQTFLPHLEGAGRGGEGEPVWEDGLVGRYQASDDIRFLHTSAEVNAPAGGDFA